MSKKNIYILVVGILVIAISIFGYLYSEGNSNNSNLSQDERILSDVDKINEISSISSEDMKKYEEKENEQEKIVDSDKVIIDEFKYLFDQPPAKQQ